VQQEASGFALRFQKALIKAVKGSWLLATGEDFRYPETEGKRPLGMGLLHWYTRRVNELTASNRLVKERFTQALHLYKSPLVLFDPRVVGAVLLKELASRRRKRVAPITQGSVTLTPSVQAGTSETRSEVLVEEPVGR